MIISVVNNSGIDVDLYIGAVRHRVFANEQQQDITVNGEFHSSKKGYTNSTSEL